MNANLKIPNPFTFKTSMEIALEVTFPVLTSEAHESLTSLLKRIPNYLRPETINTTSIEKTQLIECITAFKQTKTFTWIREDFIEALHDIERQC